ncbi:putative UMP-CMP kinase [Hypsibius exemplaris]|uniref:UMP-CMP kinase n=1 Tax=Hypsibius exemplaris TaxID=2072580 RepID=A0A9X6NCW6_HYPEX|nr:putative UMP-CMP kinase [Hypsibius exemplaris]
MHSIRRFLFATVPQKLSRRSVELSLLFGSCLSTAPLLGSVAYSSSALSPPDLAHRPSIIFFLGAAGSGKGTQCQRLTQRLPHYIHFSAGDLIRKERDTPNSQYGEIIRVVTKEPGKYVPAHITCDLLERAMKPLTKPSVTFLIDGFPANQANLTAWEELMQPRYDVRCVIFLECPEAVSVARGMSRQRGDDFEEGLRIRFREYLRQTVPIVEHYEALGMLHRIDGTQSEEVVTGDILKALNA